MRLHSLTWWVVAWWALACWGLVPWAVGDPVTLTPFRQGVTLDQPVVPPVGWTTEVDHRPGWDFGRSTLTSQARFFTGATVDLDTDAEVGVLARGLERWHPLEGLAQAGFRARVGGHSPFDWSLEGTSIVAGEAAGLWALDAQGSFVGPASGGGAPLAQVSVHWATGTSEFAPVLSPFGGLLDGEAPGVWTAVVGHRFDLYRSPGEWAMGWTLDPRLVAAGWLGSPSPAWGLGAATKFTVGRWSLGLELEATFDPWRRQWFWNVGLATP